LNGFNRVEQLGTAFRQQVCQARSRPCADQRDAILSHEFFVEAELLRLEWIARQMRIQIKIVDAEAQRGAQDDLVEHGRRSVDDQVAAARGAHDGPQVARVRFADLDLAFLAEKAPGALRIAVAAPYCVPLARQQLCQQGASAARAKNEYPHRPATLSYSLQPDGTANLACAPWTPFASAGLRA
jgi:hypothetical protein